MFWSDDQIEQVKDLAGKGMSAAMIANEVGATRNAVVGIGHRQNIKFMGTSGGYRPPKAKAELPVIEALPEPERVGMLTLLELQLNDCRWPMGDPRDPAFRYCGQRINRHSYCAAHSRLAFETTEQRRARLR